MEKRSLLIAIAFLNACQSDINIDFLGSAVLTSTSVHPSAEIGGKILQLTKDEGDMVHAGELLAQVDTQTLSLQIRELEANRNELLLTIQSQKQQVQELGINAHSQDRELQRQNELVQSQAGLVQTRDLSLDAHLLAQAKIRTAHKQILALQAKLTTMDVQKQEFMDRIHRCQILAPQNGRVGELYARQGEVLREGQNLMEIHRTDTLETDLFVPQNLLSSMRLGDSLRIRMDANTGEKWIHGQITRIGDEAEFTPKSAQTRENRQELVFRIHLKIGNPQGILHPGMPVEVWR